MTVFDLTGATVLRGARPAFENLSWTVREGESWAVVGPTGSGKTTLAEALLGKHIVRGGELKWPLFERLRAAGRAVDYPSQVVAHVSFKEDSRLFSYAGRYYQQRFEFADSASDDPLTLDAFLKTGTSATDVLTHATVYDVRALEAGRVVGTTFGKASVFLRREGEGYVLLFRRSFSDYIWRTLERATSPYGFAVATSDRAGAP